MNRRKLNKEIQGMSSRRCKYIRSVSVSRLHSGIIKETFPFSRMRLEFSFFF